MFNTHKSVGHELVRHLGGNRVQMTSRANHTMVKMVQPEAQEKITWPLLAH